MFLITDLFEELKKQRETCLIDNGKLFIEEKIAKGWITIQINGTLLLV